VLHVALRGGDEASPPWGAAISTQVRTELDRICAFAERVRNGAVLGHTGKPITDVVNLGIGGSDLGPRMAAESLAHLASDKVKVHFISNPDAWAMYSVLRGLNPATTMFVVSSKTFTTQETLTNAATAQRWLADGGCPASEQGKHLVAITASPKKTAQLGYRDDQTFLFWDWVGGRYSVWSALGLPLAIVVGAAAFRELLAGGHAMDEHFCSAPLKSNLPVLAAMLGVWNRNFLQAPTQLIVPYASRLARFTSFIQQMDMESNGKSTHVDGSACTIGTGPIVWGGLGIDGQHAYFQLVHQGMHQIPLDFIGVQTEDTPLPFAAEHYRVVKANLLAQAKAFAFGRDEATTRAELAKGGMSAEEVNRLAPHRTFRGNVASNLLWMEDLSPRSLGALIALYEHKVFVQATVWGIHAYDQWGVELGKNVVHEIYPTLT
jgi:glucose-6-phosphate isomerase